MTELGRVTFEAVCPCCNLPAVWRAEQVGHSYPNITSRIVKIDHPQEQS